MRLYINPFHSARHSRIARYTSDRSFGVTITASIYGTLENAEYQSYACIADYSR